MPYSGLFFACVYCCGCIVSLLFAVAALKFVGVVFMLKLCIVCTLVWCCPLGRCLRVNSVLLGSAVSS